MNGNKKNSYSKNGSSLRQGNMFTGVCLSTEGVLSQHALQVVSQHALQQASRWVLSQHAYIAGGIPACLAAGLQVVGGGSPGPHPREKWRGMWSRPTAKREIKGIWSRPTVKGEVEEDLVQAYTQGES